MAFTYTAGADTDLNWLRMEIDDTDSSYPLFTDGELNGLLTNAADKEEAAGEAFRAMSVDPIRLMTLLERTSGAMSLIELLDWCAKRGEQYLGS